VVSGGRRRVAGAHRGPAATDAAILSELAALRKRIEDLERLLQQQPVQPPVAEPAEPAPATSKPGQPQLGRAEPLPEPSTPLISANSLVTKLGSNVEAGGYVQFRITNSGNASGDRTPGGFEFQLTRLRPRLRLLVDQHWSSEAELNLTTRSRATTDGILAPASVSTRELFVQWQNSSLQGRAGQARIPFGYEVYLEGNSQRLELERARIFAVLFPASLRAGPGRRGIVGKRTRSWSQR
jgi:hypothetical protein